MKIAGFEFSEGSRFQAGAVTDTKAANAVGAHIEKLREQFKGELTPQDVLNDARNETSPLHSYFEWNDGEAAEQYRLQQARGLIRSVVAIYVREDAPAVRTRAYVHVPEAQTPHYREMTHAMSQKRTRQLVLQQAWRDLRGWRARYQHLSEFADLVKVMDEVEANLPAVARK